MMPLEKEVSIEALAKACVGYVGADLAALAREAALSALQRHFEGAGGAGKGIQQADFEVLGLGLGL